MASRMWVYRETLWTQSDLTGFSVEALDGQSAMSTRPLTTSTLATSR
jgi:hypothetical protein